MLIDVRTPSAYKTGRGVGTINIPRGLLELIADPEEDGKQYKQEDLDPVRQP